MKLRWCAWALLLLGCMDTRSATLGRRDAPAADDGEEEPASDAPADAEAAGEPTDSAIREAGSEARDAGGTHRHDASMADAAVEEDGGASTDVPDSRPPRRDAGGREGGATNPICRIEPWHCQ